MKKLAKGTLIIMVILLTVSNTTASASVNQTVLNSRLNALLDNDPNLTGALAGISVRDANTGQIIYEHLGNIRMRPASNMKLLTAATSLSVLGADYTFKTEVLTDGDKTGKRVKGNLFLKGKGDPTLLKKDIDYFAKSLSKSGISNIEGNIIMDDFWYDHIRYSKDLPWSDEQSYYASQVSALNVSPDSDFDTGSVIIKVRAGHKKGSPGKVDITPNTRYVKIVNQTNTVSNEDKRKIKIIREHGANTIVVKGTIPLKTETYKEYISVWEPTEYVGELFVQSLKKNGIKVKGKLKTGNTPKEAKLLFSHQSQPLSDIMVPFMKLSNNGHGETLVKEMGRTVYQKGNWNKGLDVLESQLTQFGLDTNTIVLRDGSGISHVTLIPANEISKLLFVVQKEKWFPAFLHSLPIAGNKDKIVGGTLRHRLRNLPAGAEVRAKTGTLTTVSSISGYIKTKSGQSLIFSILLNNLTDESKAKNTEDQIIHILANL